MNALEFIFDDWKKIPQNYRYLIITGVSLIFNSWLLDHWGSPQPYKYFGIDIRPHSYNLGLTLVFLALFLLVAKQFLYFGKIVWYRHKYPLNKLDIDFYLVWFNGKLILFDEKNKPKQYFHVYPWETAQDLLYVGKRFTIPVDFMPNSMMEFPANHERKILKLKNYRNGGSICTQ